MADNVSALHSVAIEHGNGERVASARVLPLWGKPGCNATSPDRNGWLA